MTAVALIDMIWQDTAGYRILRHYVLHIIPLDSKNLQVCIKFANAAFVNISEGLYDNVVNFERYDKIYNIRDEKCFGTMAKREQCCKYF